MTDAVATQTQVVSKSPIQVKIRWMLRVDLEDVVQVQQDSSNGTIEPVWDATRILEQLRDRKYIGIVATTGDKVIGFALYELCKRHFRVIKLGVHQDYRHMGVGSKLVGELTAKLSTTYHNARKKVTVMVRERNLSAQLFLRAQRFIATKVVRGFYEDSGEDGFLMEYRS